MARVRRIARLGLAILGILAGAGCAASPASPTSAGRIPALLERISSPISREDRARAEELVVQALEDLAEGHRHLMRGEDAAGLERLAAALGRVQEAQSLLPPDMIVLSTGAGKRVRLPSAREPLVVPLEALGAETLERLRPFRLEGVTGVRVDLDELERRLARASDAPEERAVGEVFIAAATALRFERFDPSYAHDDQPGRDETAGAAEGEPESGG